MEAGISLQTDASHLPCVPHLGNGPRADKGGNHDVPYPGLGDLVDDIQLDLRRDEVADILKAIPGTHLHQFDLFHSTPPHQ